MKKVKKDTKVILCVCVCFSRDGEQSTTGRTWPAHPAGLRFTCTVPCSGWIRCSPRWDPPITPYRLSPRLHCPQPCGCPHPSILVSVAKNSVADRLVVQPNGRRSHHRGFGLKHKLIWDQLGWTGWFVLYLKDVWIGHILLFGREERKASRRQLEDTWSLWPTVIIWPSRSTWCKYPPRWRSHYISFFIVLLHWLITSSHLKKQKQIKKPKVQI